MHFQLAPTRNQYSLRTGITRGTILQCLPLKILALQILMLRLNHLYRSTRQYYQTVSQINRVYLRTETSDSILVIQYLETDNHSSFTDRSRCLEPSRCASRKAADGSGDSFKASRGVNARRSAEKRAESESRGRTIAQLGKNVSGRTRVGLRNNVEPGGTVMKILQRPRSGHHGEDYLKVEKIGRGRSRADGGCAKDGNPAAAIEHSLEVFNENSSGLATSYA